MVTSTNSTLAKVPSLLLMLDKILSNVFAVLPIFEYVLLSVIVDDAWLWFVFALPFAKS